MKLKIEHHTQYTFSAPVFLEPHYLRFRPKTTPHHQLLSFELAVSPTPAGTSVSDDPENNLVDLAWFQGLHEGIAIVATSVVETTAYNPLNFLIYPNTFQQRPYNYGTELAMSLSNYLETEPISADLLAMSETLMAKNNSQLIDFLIALTHTIHNQCAVIYRHEGEPMGADETFGLKQGSCRDLTWMQLQLLRHLGLAARFVSGYFYLEAEHPAFELHAWLDVYIPGAGWLGLDPSNGLVTGHMHIPVAASHHYANTMPIIGTIRGTASNSLNTTLNITVVG
jgi:transglutaminase-like putative cysteine protease